MLPAGSVDQYATMIGRVPTMLACRIEARVARKPNFSFQKFQRENAKAMKREAKKEQRGERMRATDADGNVIGEPVDLDVPEGAVIRDADPE